MATSSGSFPRRVTWIDELTRRDHYYLDENDKCAFVGEYTAHAGFQHSQTNRLIFNLNKGMERRGKADWRYKQAAISAAAKAFLAVLNKEAMDQYTFVPIPPSKARNDPGYDDRMTQILRQIRPSQRLDVRELIIQETSTVASHVSAVRQSPDQIEALYRLDQELVPPNPRAFVVVDDMLTTGAHFKAAKSVLAQRFPGKAIFGLFVARRALPDDDDDA